MKSTKGLSEIVATLIIILLTLVAVGIIWIVIRNVVSSGSQQVNVNSECLAVSLDAVSVTNATAPASTATTYLVTLRRNSGGTDNLGGVKVTIFNSTANSGVIDFGVALTQLQTSTQTLTGPIGATSIEYTPYFIDSSGNQQLCSQTQTFTI